MGYTIGQVAEFMAAVERENKRRRIAEVLTARMAQADGKAFRDFIKRIESE